MSRGIVPVARPAEPYPTTVATLDRIRANHPQGGKLKESHTYTPVVACAPLAEQIGHEGGIAKAGAALLARLIEELTVRCKHLEETIASLEADVNGPHPLREMILELQPRVAALESTERKSGTPVHQAKVERR